MSHAADSPALALLVDHLRADPPALLYAANLSPEAWQAYREWADLEGVDYLAAMFGTGAGAGSWGIVSPVPIGRQFASRQDAVHDHAAADMLAGILAMHALHDSQVTLSERWAGIITGAAAPSAQPLPGSAVCLGPCGPEVVTKRTVLDYDSLGEG